MERIAALERELEKARSLESVSTANCAPIALLIHPGNVSAVMEQLRFRFGRPEQLIRSQLNNVREVQPISEHNLAKIIPFATRVSNLAAFLQSAKAEQHLGNPTLMEELVAKLPTSKRVDWARHAATIAPFPTVVHFSAWLQEYANVVCTVLDVEVKEPRRRLLHASVDHNECDQQDDRHGGCPIYGGQHGILNCREFIGASPQKRWSNVKRHRLCFNCLRSGHTARSCYTQGECQINGCRREHHRLLHGADEERRPLQRGGFRRHEGNQQPAVSRRSTARRPSLRDGYRDQERNRQPAVPSNSLDRGAQREVRRRVAEILESSKVSQWRWVPTADNAADDATRSQKGVDLSQESRWLRGPAFLRQPAASWPGPEEGTERVPDAPDEEEMPSEFTLVAADDFVIPFQRFSSFSRLVRTTAGVLRFARWCRKQRNELEEYGLTAAENLLVRQAQLESFPEEMRSAETGQDVARSSDIRGLVPYLDEDGILRAYGRIDAALFMPYSARRPVLLSHRHSLTELTVRDFHARMKHQNVDATIAEIRTKFWVTKMRRVMRRVISSCNECKLQRARPMPPMGGWPFKYTGLDYFGPLLVTVSRHREKRWVALS
ncbi:uncharacterized protein LOC120458585 isoform X2 [Drosophila santomea]|uniref:uncharacterized protein LOC120458585 isoform X2 n=1 Tax=Drosophila santomea TaxID=129105 RepID=UPI0019542CA1|nr:uncharacterized protein LOC120458585 isoform X2 [Drosophila santomea]